MNICFMTGRRNRFPVPPIRTPGFQVNNRSLVTSPVEFSDQAEITINSKKLLIRARDLQYVERLGRGYYGHVDKVIHKPSGNVFAVKYMAIDQNADIMKTIQRDLKIGLNSKWPSLVTCYCGLFFESEILIVMELMDISLDRLLKSVYGNGRIFPENILAHIVFSVVVALEYLHKDLHVIHRDVKPPNILADRSGNVKVCDFGISGELVDSIANTDRGTQIYLAPERMEMENSKGFTIKSDVWSLGITIYELATGKHCYRDCHPFELMKLIVNSDPPELPQTSPYSENLREFISKCLAKDVNQRSNYIQLLDTKFLKEFNHTESKTDFRTFLAGYLPPISTDN